MSGINLISPAGFTSAVLIADEVKTTGGSTDTISTITKVNKVPVSAALEIQSTLGSLLIPRMTQTQINALTTVVDGMIVYNSTTLAFNFRQNGGWQTYALTFSPPITQTTVNLTSANLLAMHGAPVTVIAAQGANTFIVVERMLFEYVFNTTAYTVAGGTEVFLQMGTGSIKMTVNIPATGLLDQTASTSAMTSGSSPTTAAANTAMANQPLQITNDTGALTAGLGTAVLTIWYSVVTLV